MKKRLRKKLVKLLAERYELEQYWLGEENEKLDRHRHETLRKRKYRLDEVLGRHANYSAHWIGMACEKLSWEELREELGI